MLAILADHIQCNPACFIPLGLQIKQGWGKAHNLLFRRPESFGVSIIEFDKPQEFVQIARCGGEHVCGVIRRFRDGLADVVGDGCITIGQRFQVILHAVNIGRIAFQRGLSFTTCTVPSATPPSCTTRSAKVS